MKLFVRYVGRNRLTRYAFLELLIIFITFFVLYEVTQSFYRTALRSSAPYMIERTLQESSDKIILHQNLTLRRNCNDTRERLPQSQSFIFLPEANSTITRALLLFYPTDQESDFRVELRWFFLSWVQMMESEFLHWRTDLIIYSDIYSPLLQELGCLNDKIRVDHEESAKCRFFPYVRVKSRTTNHQASSQYQTVDLKRSHELFTHLQQYGYIDSINTVSEYINTYIMYDYVLRTDMDCFLTRNFANYVPFPQSLLVGRGGYSNEFNSRRLRRIARDMGWRYANRISLGSTWYGSPSIMYQLANHTVEAMLYLSINEFSTPEREQRLGVMLWPDWHYGVLLLYGGHLAINHLVEAENLDICLADELLDQGVTSNDQKDIDLHRRLHLHCWHGDSPFSKFAFKAGQYDSINVSTLVNDSSSYGISTRTALQAKFMSNKELQEKLFKLTKH